MENESDSTAAQEEVRCAECNTALTSGQDREVTDDGVFCRPCFNNLRAQLEHAVAELGREINYSMAFVGGLAGAALGVFAWWAFTVVTNIAFGLVAVVIGITVGKGIEMFAGGKRHLNLQIMSVVTSTLAFFYASYLVNRTFIKRAYAEEGQEVVLSLLPDPALFIEVIALNFGIMDVVFLAIVVFQAWKIPAPPNIGG